MSLFSGLTCKACSLDVLSHEWHRKSTDALNNNLRPKSDCHGTLISSQEYRRYQVPEICSEEEDELEEEGGGEEEENITISNESRCLFKFSTTHQGAMHKIVLWFVMPSNFIFQLVFKSIFLFI